MSESQEPSNTMEPEKPAECNLRDTAEESTHDMSKTDSQIKKRTKTRVTFIMISLCVAVFLAALDVTIVTTALPTIAEYFKSDAAYTWVGSSFVLATAAATPLWGKVSDIFGRKPVLLLANVVFFIGSLVAALSNSVGMLITARAIQGLGGGGLLVLVNIVIGDLFSPRDRGAYYGIVGGVWALALSLGPVVGGAFAEKVSWRWCFYINLPFDGLALALLIFLLDLKTPTTPILAGLKATDWLGSLLIIGGTLMFLFGLTYGGAAFPWDSATVLCLIVFGLVCVLLFGIVEWKFAKYPIIPIRLFENRSLFACFAVCFLHGFVFIGALYYLPLFFQSALGASPILSGVYILALSVAMSISAMGTGAYINATGNALYPMYFGLTFMTLGFGLFINLDADRDWAKIIIYQIITGLGIGPVFQAPLVALQGRTAPQDVAVATSAFEFTRNLATAISIVVGGVIFDNQIGKMRTALVGQLPPNVVQALTNGGAGAATQLVNQLPGPEKRIAQTAFANALRPIWYLYVALAFVAVMVSLLIAKNELSREHKETETGLEAEEANRLAHKQHDETRRAEKAERRGIAKQ